MKEKKTTNSREWFLGVRRASLEMRRRSEKIMLFIFALRKSIHSGNTNNRWWKNEKRFREIVCGRWNKRV